MVFGGLSVLQSVTECQSEVTPHIKCLWGEYNLCNHGEATMQLVPSIS